jgi:hypothetical protein
MVFGCLIGGVCWYHFLRKGAIWWGTVRGLFWVCARVGNKAGRAKIGVPSIVARLGRIGNVGKEASRLSGTMGIGIHRARYSCCLFSRDLSEILSVSCLRIAKLPNLLLILPYCIPLPTLKLPSHPPNIPRRKQRIELRKLRKHANASPNCSTYLAARFPNASPANFAKSYYHFQKI